MHGEVVDLAQHGARANAVRLVVVVDVLAQLVHQHHALRLTIRVELETEILVLIGKKTNIKILHQRPVDKWEHM